MSKKIHVYNASSKKVTVQCYKPNSTDAWGGTHTIDPGTSAMVYEAGFFNGNTDLVIAQHVILNQPDGKQKEVKIKETRFHSDRNTSWIVKELNVVQQEYGKGLDKEHPNGKKHDWQISAKKFTLKSVVYHDLPEKPNEWKPNMVNSGEIRNLNSEIATVSGKIGLSYSETKTWSKNIGIKGSIKTEVKAGIPLLVEGGVEVGLELSYEYTWGESHTENKSWEQTVSVPVQSNKMVEFSGKAMQGILTVPYTATFILEYEGSEEKVEAQVQGEYEGVCAKKTEIQVSLEKSLSIPPVIHKVNFLAETPIVNFLAETPTNKPAADIVSTITMVPGSKASG